ncbi:MAG: hypothetical protein M3245_01270 [Actinomycetota bacterium]|nr:hypothetical protein [Actinomycetota bacterium]
MIERAVVIHMGGGIVPATVRGFVRIRAGVIEQLDVTLKRDPEFAEAGAASR